MYMQLKLYLVKNRLTIKEFGEMIGYSRNQISGIVNNKLKPSLRLAKVIEKATNGEVTVDELLKDASTVRKNRTTEINPKTKEKLDPKISPKGWQMERSVFDEGE